MNNFIQRITPLSMAAVLTVSATFAQAQVVAPQPSPSAKTTQTVGTTDITLDYSRPSSKGRKVYGDLVPFGKIWRTGANASTKITFGDSVMIGTAGKLKKGTYSIFTIPNKGEWTVIFSKSLELWGADGYKDENDAYRLNIKTTALNDKIETFNIDFKNITNNGADLCIEWENTRVAIPISVPTDQKVMASIKATMDGPSAGSYVSAARYYLDSDKDPKQALEWINKGLEKGGERYWILRAKSLIQAKLGDKKGAVETAKRSLELAKKEGNADYVKMNEDSIKEWSK